MKKIVERYENRSKKKILFKVFFGEATQQNRLIFKMYGVS